MCVCFLSLSPPPPNVSITFVLPTTSNQLNHQVARLRSLRSVAIARAIAQKSVRDIDNSATQKDPAQKASEEKGTYGGGGKTMISSKQDDDSQRDDSKMQHQQHENNLQRGTETKKLQNENKAPLPSPSSLSSSSSSSSVAAKTFLVSLTPQGSSNDGSEDADNRHEQKQRKHPLSPPSDEQSSNSVPSNATAAAAAGASATAAANAVDEVAAAAAAAVAPLLVSLSVVVDDRLQEVQVWAKAPARLLLLSQLQDQQQDRDQLSELSELGKAVVQTSAARFCRRVGMENVGDCWQLAQALGQ
jgi:hypothetical protein